MARRRDISAGKAFVELYLRDSKLRRGLRRSSMRLQAWGDAVTKFGAVISAAGTGIVGGILKAVEEFAEFGDMLDKMSARTGATVEELSELKFAAEQSGSGIDQLGQALFRSTRRIANAATGTGPAVRALDELGLSAERLSEMTAGERFEVLVGALNQVPNAGRRAQLGFEIFGDNIRQIMPLIDAGVDGIRDLREQARDLGLTKTEEQTKKAAQVTDAINRIRRAMEAIVFEIGFAVADVVLQAMAQIQTVVKATSEWVRANEDLVRMIGAIGVVLVAVGGAIAGFGAAITGAGLALFGMSQVLGAIGAVLGFLLTPIGLIAGALVAGVTYWFRYTEAGQKAAETIGNGLSRMAATGNKAVRGIVDALTAGDLQMAGQLAMEGLQQIVLEGFRMLQQAVGGIWGDVLGHMGSQIASGDIHGAIQTGLAAIATQFEQWGAATIAYWSEVAQGIVQLYREALAEVEQASRAMANFMGDTIEGAGGLIEGLGTGGAMLGGKAPKEEADVLAVRHGTRGLAEFFRQGTGKFFDLANAELDREQEAFNASMEEWRKTSRESAEGLRDALGDETGATDLDEMIAASDKRLDELAASASKKADEARTKMREFIAGLGLPGELGDLAPEEAAAAPAVAASFNAAALGALGRGGGVRSEVVRKLQDLVKEAKKQTETNVEIKEKLEPGVFL